MELKNQTNLLPPAYGVDVGIIEHPIKVLIVQLTHWTPSAVAGKLAGAD